MADDKTFLEKYREHILGEESEVFDKLSDEILNASPNNIKTPERDSLDNPPAEAKSDKTPEDKKVSPVSAASKEGKATEVAANVALPPEDDTLEKVLAELDLLVGLEDIKTHVKTVINLLKVQKERREHDLPTVEVGLHRLFTGNPGTGKTTVARLMGRIYKATGRLSKGQLVETDRSGLVGGFVGQTAIKTVEVLNSAKGGVLFLDEAYSLVPGDGAGNDFGQEAITTILKFMEDNRDDFVFIGAGYPLEMQRFINSNSGFASRFNEILEFEDYDGAQLCEIFNGMLKKNQYVLDKRATEKTTENFEWFIENKNSNFANGRLVRKYFEALVQNQANRLGKSRSEMTKSRLRRILVSDLPTNLAELL